MAGHVKNSGKAGLRRYEYDGVLGWQVRYRREGVRFQKVFSDRIHGGTEAALAAAESFHAQLLEYFPPMTRREYANIRKANSKETVGVSRIIKRERRNGKEYIYEVWQARWTNREGLHRNKNFYISRHGEAEAKRLAEELRKAKIAEYGDALVDRYNGDLIWVTESEDFAIAANIDPEGDFEGALALRLHRSKERSRELRVRKVNQFRNDHGAIFCEICHFSFESTYGTLAI